MSGHYGRPEACRRGRKELGLTEEISATVGLTGAHLSPGSTELQPFVEKLLVVRWAEVVEVVRG